MSQFIHKMGAPRISTTLRLGTTRTDKNQTMEEKIKMLKIN